MSDLKRVSNETIVKVVVTIVAFLAVFIGVVVVSVTVGVVVGLGGGSSGGSNIPVSEHVKGYKNSDILVETNVTITSLESVVVVKPMYGSIRMDSNNKTTVYHANKYYSGNDTFEYKADERLVTVNVEIINRDPKTIPLTFATPKNVPQTFDIFQNVTDQDGDLLELVSVSSTRLPNSIATISSDKKQITYTPCKNCIGTDSFTYTVTDFNSSSTSTISIQLTNNLPITINDEFTIVKNKEFIMNVLSNDRDEENDDLFIIATDGSQGRVEISSDQKSVKYYPKASGEVYVDSFEYVVTDDLSNTYSNSTGIVTVHVSNTPPNVFEKQVYLQKNSEGSEIDLTFNDNDILDTVSVKMLNNPKKGSFSFTEKSSVQSIDYFNQQVNITKFSYQLSYTPEKNISYSESILLNVTDGYSFNVTSLTIFVVNTPPTAVNDTATCVKNSQIEIQVVSNDFDQDGDSIKLSTSDWESTSSNGGLVERTTDNSLIYKAPQGFVGLDTVKYYITDGESSSSGYLNIQVQSIIPVAVSDVFTVTKGISSFLNVLQNDYSPSDDQFTLTQQSVRALNRDRSAVRSINNQGVVGYEYTALNQSYTDVFYYTITDAFGFVSQSANVTINVVNTPPKALDDEFVVSWNRNSALDVLKNDFDENESDLPFLVIERVLIQDQSLVSIVEDGKKLLLAPPKGFIGVLEFSYVISDTFDESNIAKVKVSIVNNAPQANDDTFTVDVHWRNANISINVLQNDIDLDGDLLSIVSFTQPIKGKVTKKANDIVEFTLSDKFIGLLTFTYQITDGNLTSTATVFINVKNNAPIANDDTFTLHWNSQYDLNILSNDYDIDNDPITIISQSFNGLADFSLDYSTNTTLKFKPSSIGSFNVSYSISDGISQSLQPATIALTVTNNNKPSPITIEQTLIWNPLNPIFIPISNTTRDLDGDLLFISSYQKPLNGSIIQLNIGNSTTPASLTIRINQGFNGTDTFKVILSDGMNSAIITIVINTYIPKCFNRLQTDPLSCSGHGTCVSNENCACQTGWSGANCSIPICFGLNNTSPTVCSGRGFCVAYNQCNCTTSGYGGSDCSKPICYGQFGTNACGGTISGVCISPNNCTCLTGWGGSNCTTLKLKVIGALSSRFAGTTVYDNIDMYLNGQLMAKPLLDYVSARFETTSERVANFENLKYSRYSILTVTSQFNVDYTAAELAAIKNYTLEGGLVLFHDFSSISPGIALTNIFSSSMVPQANSPFDSAKISFPINTNSHFMQLNTQKTSSITNFYNSYATLITVSEPDVQYVVSYYGTVNNAVLIIKPFGKGYVVFFTNYFSFGDYFNDNKPIYQAIFDLLLIR